MNTLIHRIIRENWRPERAALAGLVATAAYFQNIDRHLVYGWLPGLLYGD